MNRIEEQKRYRNNFIMLTLISVFGILSGLFLYEYTDFFGAVKEELLTDRSRGFDIDKLISLYYEEMKIPLILLIFGFTLFSPYIASICALYKGFITGFSTLFFGLQYQGGAISAKEFQIICALMISSAVIYVIIAAKSMCFGACLKYAAPDIASLFRQKMTRQYLLTFLLLSSFLMIITVIRCAVSYT